MLEDEKLPFTSHLEELRKRLITAFIAVGVGFVIAFAFKERLFNILVQPLINVMKEGETLIYTGLPEAFFTYLKVAFLTGLMVASPANPLQAGSHADGSLNLHDMVDGAHVDAKLERRSCDHGREISALERFFDLDPLLPGHGPVVGS